MNAPFLSLREQDYPLRQSGAFLLKLLSFPFSLVVSGLVHRLSLRAQEKTRWLQTVPWPPAAGFLIPRSLRPSTSLRLFSLSKQLAGHSGLRLSQALEVFVVHSLNSRFPGNPGQSCKYHSSPDSYH